MTKVISSKVFFSTLAQHRDSALIFQTGDTRVKPGYHVTELKQTSVSSLDCGRGTDEWNELVIQLLDGPPISTAGHMSVDKFLNIARSAADSADQKLSFEFSPGNGPLLKLSANDITHTNHETVVQLDALAAECKPMKRLIASAGRGCCC